MHEWVLRQTGARALTEVTRLQELWGGYGELLRLRFEGAPSAILKRIAPPEGARQSVSGRRKRRSYEVELNWYQEGARRCDSDCRVAACLAVERPSLLLLEDLQNAGFHPRGRQGDLRAGLRWLAHFHARFLDSVPEGLWEQGTYWHLETRREEWQRMPPSVLKDAAEAWDRRLRAARFQTLLHGDAKPANFLWTADGRAAAVDFQYTGPGAGIRDVAYFLDCCVGEDSPEDWLDFYFGELRHAVGSELNELEAEWRSLFPVAWSDFCRFEQGWRGSFPLGPYSRRQIEKALS